jgi:hypothetical protein
MFENALSPTTSESGRGRRASSNPTLLPTNTAGPTALLLLSEAEDDDDEAKLDVNRLPSLDPKPGRGHAGGDGGAYLLRTRFRAKTAPRVSVVLWVSWKA